MNITLVDEGAVKVVQVSGRLQIEKAAFFKKILSDNLKGSKVVFVMDQLSFVGSTGIQVFFRAIEEARKDHQIDSAIVGLKPDFKKFMSLVGIQTLDFHEKIEQALFRINSGMAFTETAVSPNLSMAIDELEGAEAGADSEEALVGTPLLPSES